MNGVLLWERSDRARKREREKEREQEGERGGGGAAVPTAERLLLVTRQQYRLALPHTHSVFLLRSQQTRQYTCALPCAPSRAALRALCPCPGVVVAVAVAVPACHPDRTRMRVLGLELTLGMEEP